MLTTFEDCIRHACDYVGGSISDVMQRDAKRAILESYRDISNAHNWSYYYTHGRVITTAPFDGPSGGPAATFSYIHSGGLYDRMATISGGTWPTWAVGSYLRSGTVAYKVAERKSATVLTFDELVNPGADLPAGTTFQLYRDSYLLPADYKSQDQALYEQNFGGLNYAHPRDWLYENRYVLAAGIPQAYTITGDVLYPGRLLLRVFPWPTEARSIDFVYQRHPRSLLLPSYAVGTAATVQDSATVTISVGAFRPEWVGSVLRVSGTAKPPTSVISGDPPAVEGIITAWLSATQVTIDVPADVSIAAGPYTVSDPIDVEPGAMLNCFLRCVEKHVGMNRTLKDKPSAALQYKKALDEARAGDSRSFTGRSAGPQSRIRRRMRDMPMTWEIE